MSESDAQKFLRSIEGTLEIPQAQAAPGWTSTRPDKPGWYWHKGPSFEPMIFLLDQDEDGVMFLVEGGCWDIEELTGKWSGPLAPPEGDAHGRK